METNKQKNSPLVFYILGFIAAIFFELYWINNYPFDYFMIIGIGLVVLITGYLTFDGIIKAYNESQEIKREQNEIMIKAQKAIYLATKKNSAEAENMQIQNLKAVNLLMDRMVDTITEKQIAMNGRADSPMDLSGLINELTESNAKLAKELQNAITVNQLVKANEDLIRNVQDILGERNDTASVSKDNLSVQESYNDNSADVNDSIDVSGDFYADDSVDVSGDFYADDSVDVSGDFYADDSVDISGDFNTDDSVDASDDFNTDDSVDVSGDFNADDSVDISDISDNIDEISEMEDDIATAEAAVADMSQTIEAIEAADELDASMTENETENVTGEMDSDDSLEAAASDLDNDPNAAMTPEEIAKLFESL